MWGLVRVETDDNGQERYIILSQFSTEAQALLAQSNYVNTIRTEIIKL